MFCSQHQYTNPNYVEVVESIDNGDVNLAAAQYVKNSNEWISIIVSAIDVDLPLLQLCDLFAIANRYLTRAEQDQLKDYAEKNFYLTPLTL